MLPMLPRSMECPSRIKVFNLTRVIVLVVATKVFAVYRINLTAVQHPWPSQVDKENRITVPTHQSLNLNAPINLLETMMRVNLRNTKDKFYTAQITVGSPAVPLDVMLDTGSSFVVLKDSSMYKPTSSSSAHIDSDSAVFTSYGIGSAEGTLVWDEVCLGELCSNQTFILGKLTVLKADGIFGINPHVIPGIVWGKSSETLIRGLTFAQHLAASSGFQDLAMDVTLRGQDDSGGSFILLGEWSELEAKYGGACVRAAIYHATYLQPSLSIVVDSKVVVNKILPAGLDTGSSFLVVPEAEYADMMQNLIPDHAKHCVRGGDSLPNLPSSYTICECNATIGDMVWTFHDTDGRSIDITLGKKSLFTQIQMGDESEDDLDLCVLSIITGFKYEFWILGDVFFRESNVIFEATAHVASVCPKRNELTLDRDLESKLKIGPEPSNPIQNVASTLSEEFLSQGMSSTQLVMFTAAAGAVFTSAGLMVMARRYLWLTDMYGDAVDHTKNGFPTSLSRRLIEPKAGNVCDS